MTLGSETFELDLWMFRKENKSGIGIEDQAYIIRHEERSLLLAQLNKRYFVKGALVV